MPPKAPAKKSPAKKTVAKKSTAPAAKPSEPAAKSDEAAASKDTAAAEGAELPGLAITIKQLPDILFRDVGDKVKESGKWPLIIDGSNQAATYLRYQDTNYLNALAPRDMTPDIVRLAVLGSIRYGKALVIDMMEVDMFQTISDRMDELLPGMLAMIMDKSILEEENYLKLVKPEDGEAYQKQNFSPMRTENFKVFLITKNIFPSEKLIAQTYVLRINIPE